MKNLPVKANEQGRRFSVEDFFEEGRESLGLVVVAGKQNLKREIVEPIVNRPGLALTGFYEHFAWGRLQMIGKGEMAYLRSLSPSVRSERVRSLIERKAFCFIYTNGQKPAKSEIELANSLGAVIMTSPLKTRIFASRATFVLESLGAPSTSIYGTMMEVFGLGVLFEGDPGLGKSETALGLIKRGHALVADYLTCIRKDVANAG